MRLGGHGVAAPPLAGLDGDASQTRVAALLRGKPLTLTDSLGIWPLLRSKEPKGSDLQSSPSQFLFSAKACPIL